MSEPERANRGECDPFTPELVISAMSLIATVVGTYFSYITIKHSSDHDELLTKLINLVLEIQTSVDDIALLLGQAAPDLGDKVPSFESGGFRLNALTFVRYARVETKLTQLFTEIRELSVELRRAAVQSDTELEYKLFGNKCVSEIDELFRNLGRLTTADFVDRARGLLADVQYNLWELRGHRHL